MPTTITGIRIMRKGQWVYNGQTMELPDGTLVDLSTKSISGGRPVDIHHSNGTKLKMHIQ